MNDCIGEFGHRFIGKRERPVRAGFDTGPYYLNLHAF